QLIRTAQAKGCSAPQRTDFGANAKADSQVAFLPRPIGSTHGMRLISSGEFLMGSETEPPVHTVEVAAFYIDITCVTNEQFGEFVNATRYKTEAERSGWSFG